MAENVLTHILLLRGLIREQRHWGSFPSVLQSALPNVQFHFLDLPGVGTELSRDSPFTVAGIMNDLRERWLLLREKHPGNWGLFSISLGSMVALEWGKMHPHDFLWISLMNTSASNAGGPFSRLKLSALSKIFQIALAKSSYEKELKVLEMTTSCLENPSDLAKIWARFSMPSRRARAVALAQLIAASRFRLPPRVPVSMCMFIGLADKMVNPKCSEVIAEFYDLDCFKLANGGHDLCLDDPHWVSETLKGWLNRQSFLVKS